MKGYKDIYPHEIEDFVKKGEYVYVADKQEMSISELNNMPYSEVIDLTNIWRTQNSRVSFYVEVENDD